MVRFLGLDGGPNPFGEVKHLAVRDVVPNPYQPRVTFSQTELEDLAASIRQYGVLQPVLVRPQGRNYELVAGERRLQASKLLGLPTIPAIIKKISDQDIALLALVENLQREDLRFLEEAQGYQRILIEFGLTQEELAKRLGKSQSTIANKLRLLKLPGEIREIISREMLTERHARALLRLKKESLQMQVLNKMVAEGLTVQETEDHIEEILFQKDKPKKKAKRKIIKVYKDMRIFFNSMRQAVEELQRVGFPASFEQEEKEDHYEVKIIIPKNKGEKKSS